MKTFRYRGVLIRINETGACWFKFSGHDLFADNLKEATSKIDRLLAYVNGNEGEAVERLRMKMKELKKAGG